MKRATDKITLLAAIPVLILVVSFRFFDRTGDAVGASALAAANAQTQNIVAATTAFLGSLSAAQREKVQFTFTPQKTATAAKFKGGMGGRMTFIGEQYGQAVWSNFPVSDVPRPGLTLGSLTAVQREAAMKLLQVLLSPQGYQKVLDIMGSDQALADGGTPFSSGTNYYTLGIFGNRSTTTPWMLQFGAIIWGLISLSRESTVSSPRLSPVPNLPSTRPTAR